MKFSIIMPVYNAGAYLTAALDSLFANACDGVTLDIILVDDCSPDPDTQARLAHYATHPGVRVLRQPRNGGPSAARNAGLRAAEGDWIGFLDADDLFAPGTIALRRDAIAALPQIRWMAGDMLEMRREGELAHFASFDARARAGREVLPGLFELPRPTASMVDWPMLPVLGSMMVRRDLLDEIGLFDVSLHFGEDIYFCLLASTCADLYWVTTPCLYLRRHHESMTKDVLRLASESPRYTRRLLGDPRLRIVRKQLRWQHAASLRHKARVSLRYGRRLRALGAALASIVWTPNNVDSFALVWRACFGAAGAPPVAAGSS